MQSYDPDQAPDPKEWLVLGADERIRLVERYYAGEGGYGGSLGGRARGRRGERRGGEEGKTLGLPCHFNKKKQTRDADS